MSVNEKMTAIADAIRDKTGGTEALTLDDMMSSISEVYETGKKDGNDAFWDAYQDHGNRGNYEYAFLYWGNEYIRPKYKVIADKSTRAIRIFCNCVNLKKMEKEFFDFSAITPSANGSSSNSVYEVFRECSQLEKIEDIGIQAGGYYYTFSKCKNLHTIEILRCVETGTYTAPFNECNSLKNIIIEGVIGNSISFSYSPLTVASLKSIITHLKNYAGTENAGKCTLTLKDSCKTLMEEQGTIAELGGKTYDAYIADIGWNLA